MEPGEVAPDGAEATTGEEATETVPPAEEGAGDTMDETLDTTETNPVAEETAPVEATQDDSASEGYTVPGDETLNETAFEDTLNDTGVGLETRLNDTVAAATEDPVDSGDGADAASPEDAPAPVASEVPADEASAENAPAEVPAEAAPADEIPTEAAPAEAAAEDAAPIEVAPIEAAPTDAAPADSAPIEAAPIEAAPTDAAPAEAEPIEAAADAAATEAALASAIPALPAEIGVDLADVARIPETLRLAVHNQDPYLIEKLIHAGADVSNEKDGRTCLDIANDIGNDAVIQMLLKYGAPPGQVKPSPAPAPVAEVAPAAPEADAGVPNAPSAPSSAPNSNRSRKKETTDLKNEILLTLEEPFGPSNPTTPMSRNSPSKGKLSKSQSSPYMTSLSQFGRSPKWTMSNRQHHGPGMGGMPKWTPPPGTYEQGNIDLVRYKTAPKFGFGTGNRFGDNMGNQKIKHPGPGQYNPNDPNLVQSHVGFGTSARPEMGQSKRSPGPGTYEAASQVGRRGGPMFTARGRFSAKDRSHSTPGPGTYSIPSTLSGSRPGLGISSRKDENKRMERKTRAPGPGAYDPYLYTEFGATSAKYSLYGVRKNFAQAGTPGPGDYNTDITSFGY